MDPLELRSNPLGLNLADPRSAPDVSDNSERGRKSPVGAVLKFPLPCVSQALQCAPKCEGL